MSLSKLEDSRIWKGEVTVYGHQNCKGCGNPMQIYEISIDELDNVTILVECNQCQIGDYQTYSYK